MHWSQHPDNRRRLARVLAFNGDFLSAVKGAKQAGVSGPESVREASLYLNPSCSFSSSALPGQSSSYGTWASGVSTVLFCSWTSRESGER